jgi:RNA polymerase-interacting CarD/CdnL/TRCF family regulator
VNGHPYRSLQEKLRGGDVRQVAKVVRDMFWRDHHSRRLTIQDKRLYERGLVFLTSEVAVMQGCDLAVAEAKISSILAASLVSRRAV